MSEASIPSPAAIRDEPAYLAAKRALDVLLALVLLVPSLPLLLISVVGTKLTSTGPMLFRAKRAGKDGFPFDMLKLRTMLTGSETGSAITAPDDARITPFGSLMRTLKTDELPQLYNVLRGDMSFVGPRPEDLRIVEEHYTPFLHLSLSVQPGLTSPGTLHVMEEFHAAVSRDDAETSYAENILEEKLTIDIDYLSRQTIGGELVIIARTGLIIFRKIASGKTRE